jgi:hypothetical protein
VLRLAAAAREGEEQKPYRFGGVVARVLVAARDGLMAGKLLSFRCYFLIP